MHTNAFGYALMHIYMYFLPHIHIRQPWVSCKKNCYTKYSFSMKEKDIVNYPFLSTKLFLVMRLMSDPLSSTVKVDK